MKKRTVELKIDVAKMGRSSICWQQEELHKYSESTMLKIEFKTEPLLD